MDRKIWGYQDQEQELGAVGEWGGEGSKEPTRAFKKGHIVPIHLNYNGPNGPHRKENRKRSSDCSHSMQQMSVGGEGCVRCLYIQ